MPSAEIANACGGDPSDGILACYGADDQTMIVPGDQAPQSTISVNYVITHEHGHHIAAHRANAPLAALDFGRKRWSSYELVCANAIDGRLAPATRAVNYLSNPGEAWARGVRAARLPERGVAHAAAQATPGPALAAMADIAQPWTKRTSTTFSGARTKTFKLPITLDGAFTLQLDGPKSSDYDLVVRSGGKTVERTTRKDSHDRIPYGRAGSALVTSARRSSTVAVRSSGWTVSNAVCV